MKRVVEAARLQEEPYLVWNAFIDLIAVEDYEELSPLQRKAHLVFWYESEVQNGGHGQYFENRGLHRLEETVNALAELGLTCQAEVLVRATAALRVSDPRLDWSEALDDSFVAQLDQEFHDCRATILDGLEKHLAKYVDEYVEIE